MQLMFRVHDLFIPVDVLLDKSTSKFKDWLGIEQKLNQEVIEVFGYLAYETVREVSVVSSLFQVTCFSW